MSGLEVARTSAVTPLMFEHQVLDRAIADRRHIVLPEGEEERILRAADVLLRGAKGCGHNNFKIGLARRAIIRTLSQAARGAPQSISDKKIR